MSMTSSVRYCVAVVLVVGGCAMSAPGEEGPLCSVHVSLGETTVSEGQWADLIVALRNESSHPLGLPNNVAERVDIFVRQVVEGETNGIWTRAFNIGRMSATMPGAPVLYAPNASMAFERVVMMDDNGKFLFESPGRYELKARLRDISSAQIKAGVESNVVDFVIRPRSESDDERLEDVFRLLRGRHRVERQRVSFDEIYEAWQVYGPIHPQLSAAVGMGLLDRASAEQGANLATTGVTAILEALNDAHWSNDAVVARCVDRLIGGCQRWPSICTRQVERSIQAKLDEKREYPASVMFAHLAESYRISRD